MQSTSHQMQGKAWSTTNPRKCCERSGPCRSSCKELQQKVEFVDHCSDKRSHRKKARHTVTAEEELARFREPMASRTGYIDNDAIEILKLLYNNDPDALTKFPCTQYFGERKSDRSAIPFSVVQAAGTAAPSTPSPRQYGDPRKSNLATKEGAESSDDEAPATNYLIALQVRTLLVIVDSLGEVSGFLNSAGCTLL